MSDQATIMEKARTDDPENAEIPEGTSIADVSAETLIRYARDSHLWRNGLSCINPTAEFCETVGRIILQKLETTPLRDELGVSNLIILTVNKS